MPAPAILIIAPVIVAVLVFLFRRWPTASALLGTAAAVALAIYISQVDTVIPGSRVIDQSTGSAWVVYGRPLILGRSDQTVLLFSYIMLAFLFILTLVAPQSKTFIPVSLAVMSPLAAVLMAQPFIFGAILLLVVASLSAVLIQGERSGSTLSSIRLLSMTALAVPLLLLAGWMIDTNQIQFLPTVILLILAALLILMNAFPFQFWVSPAVSESGALVPAAVFGIINLLVIAFTLRLLVTNPVIYGNVQFLRIIGIIGAATLILASLLLLSAQSFGRLLGYLLLLDVGATVLALSVGGRIAFETVLSILVLRIFGLIIAGMGFGLIRRQLNKGSENAGYFSHGRGLAWRTPLGIALFVYGGLSLVGAPLTPGFVGRWLLVTMPSELSFFSSVLLMLSVAAGVVGLSRVLVLSLSLESGSSETVIPESKGVKIAAGLLLAGGILLAFFPQLILTNVKAMASLF